jgi:hypothetical protein
MPRYRVTNAHHEKVGVSANGHASASPSEAAGGRFDRMLGSMDVLPISETKAYEVTNLASCG